jgi:1-acyl-sn-glycerol-3-phosphate acyltransferase
LLYSLIKTFTRLALKIFCRKMVVMGLGLIPPGGPVLIVANHPSSFLDAIIIGSIFGRPVHFLARGDAFRKPWHNRLLRLLNMIPVYRLSEDKENLHLNETAFKRSREILSRDGIVLIFIEGISVNKHELQPFKKGAARIALESTGNENLQILPLAIAYDSFKRVGKQVNINIAKPLLVKPLFPFEEEAKNIRHFNSVLYEEIERRIVIPSDAIKESRTKKRLLFLPGIIGYCLHFPLYFPIRSVIRKKTKGTIFFDSVLFGVLLILYPLYTLLICWLLYFLAVPFFLIVLIFFLYPVLAWCAVQWRRSG